MKVRVEDSCTSCELCVEMCPDVFQMGSSQAEVITNPIPPESEDDAQEAADQCPVEAIIIE